MKKIFDFHVHAQYAHKSIHTDIPYIQKCGIQKMLLIGDVLGLGYNCSEDEIMRINDHNFDIVNAHPELCFGFGFLNPLLSATFLHSEIDRCVKSGALGIKLEVSTLASDKRVWPIMEQLKERGMPLIHHTWNTRVIGRNTIKDCFQTDAEDIAVLAQAFPDVKIIAAHLRGNGIRGIIELKKYENVFFDTSGGQPMRGILEYAVKKIGAHRILYGSDAYFPDGRDFPSQISAVEAAEIKDSEKEDIFWNNAVGLLKVSTNRQGSGV